MGSIGRHYWPQIGPISSIRTSAYQKHYPGLQITYACSKIDLLCVNRMCSVCPLHVAKNGYLPLGTVIGVSFGLESS